MIESRRMRRFRRLAPFALAVSLIISTPARAAEEASEPWAALVKGGHVALIRHGNAHPCAAAWTAQLMAVEQVESSWALIPDTVPGSTSRFLQLKELVSTWRGPGTLVLVTHGLAVRR